MWVVGDPNRQADRVKLQERQTATGNKEGEEESGVKKQGALASLTHRKRSMYCSKQQGQDPLPHIHAAAGTRTGSLVPRSARTKTPGRVNLHLD